MVRDLVDQFVGLDLPFLRTTIELAWRPGVVAARYLDGRRRRYTQPLKYCLLAATVEVLLLQWIGLPLRAASAAPSAVRGLARAAEETSLFFVDYLGFTTLVTLPLLAGLLRALMPGKRSFEHSMVLCLYCYGISFLAQTVLLVLAHWWPGPMLVLTLLVPFVVLGAAVGDFYPGGRALNAIVATVAQAAYFGILLVVQFLIILVVALRG